MRFLFATLLLIPACFAESYLPPYIEGIPEDAQVSSLDPPDIRKQPVYRVDFSVRAAGTGELVMGLIHRTYDEFTQFDEKLKKEYPDFSYPLPTSEVADVSTLDQYIVQVFTLPGVRDLVLLHDFLGINWNGKDIGYMNSLEGFMDMLLFHHVPAFMPEPTVIESEADIFEPETPFEAYVFVMSFRHDKRYTAEYMQFFRDYTDNTPGFEGPVDDTDVWFPGQTAPLDYPRHYNQTYVHFLPGGYMNGHTVRINYQSKNKFTFLDESKITEWLVQLYPDITPPKTILDVGTGGCFSAFALAELYPESQVIGVDMSAPAIRFCRQWKAYRGTPNVEFYQGNGESLSFLQSEYFDFINYAYVLHEMPGENAQRVVSEMYRLLKPGGLLHGFDVPYSADPVEAGLYTLFNTWGYNWDTTGNHGPEPYIEEYMFTTHLPDALNNAGFENVEMIPYALFDSIYKCNKPALA